jgi:hypothetical protein
LEHHLHDRTSLAPIALVCEIATLYEDRAAGRGLQAENHAGNGRFAGAAFAGEAEDLAPIQPEADIVDSAHLAPRTAEQAAPNRKGFGDSHDFDEGLAHAVASRRQQAADCSGPTSKWGGAVRHAFTASGQRGAKRHPGGGAE